MSAWGGEIGQLGAVRKREERTAKKRQREIERQLKEQAKLSALEQARLEVEAYENTLDVLLSVHKEQHSPVGWDEFAISLPPHEPPRLGRHELAALLEIAVSKEPQSTEDQISRVLTARYIDEREYQEVRAEYQGRFARWDRTHSLAQRVLAGDARAYTQAVSEFPNLAEIANLGSSIHMTVHDAKLVACALKVNGLGVIPSDAKSLTAAGKVAIRPMPKSRFHEIYQDYICGCILRLAREIFALLPVDTVLLTAIVDGIDTRTGRPAEMPVLSVVAPRGLVEQLDFDRLVPSDAIENFQHRGDVITSRRSDTFVQIAPLTPEEISQKSPESMDLSPLLIRIKQLSTEFTKLLKPSITGIAKPPAPTDPAV